MHNNTSQKSENVQVARQGESARKRAEIVVKDILSANNMDGKNIVRLAYWGTLRREPTDAEISEGMGLSLLTLQGKIKESREYQNFDQKDAEEDMLDAFALLYGKDRAQEIMSVCTRILSEHTRNRDCASLAVGKGGGDPRRVAECDLVNWMEMHSHKHGLVPLTARLYPSVVSHGHVHTRVYALV